MPWVNQRQKLRETIAKELHEVEKEHPPTDIEMTQISSSPDSITPNPSFNNSSFNNSSLNNSGAYILRSSSGVNIISNNSSLNSSSAQILSSSTPLSRALSSPYLTRIHSQNTIVVPKRSITQSSSPSLANSKDS